MNHPHLHALRAAALALPVLLALGCQDVAAPPGGTGDPQVAIAVSQAVDVEDFTADASMVSDEDVFATAAPASGVPADGGVRVNAGGTQFQRTIATSTRTKAVTLNGDSTTATVVVTEDRSGTLAVRDFGSAIVVQRPFADHGTRQVALVKGEGTWHVSASSFLNRPSTVVVSPVGVASVTITSAGRATMTFTSASDLLNKANWPAMPTGDVAVKVTLNRTGGRVFLHERYGRDATDRRKMEMTPDPSNPKVFTLTWHPALHEAEASHPWRRLLTVDAFDALTLATNSTGAYIYNNQQWVIPVALQQQ